jgi:hypothetical protein
VTDSSTTDDFSNGRLRGLRLLGKFRKRLRKELSARTPDQIEPSEKDPRRLLLAENSFSALLLCYYNPVLKSACAVVATSKTSATVRRAPGSDRPLSLGSFSEAQHLFDADLFNVLDGSIEDAAVTEGAACERRVLAARIEAGRLYCGDRYYSFDYSYFERLRQGGADALIRIRDQPEHTVIKERPLSAEAKAYGVVSDQTVVLGPDADKHPSVRMITLRREGKLIRLVTTLEEHDAVELCLLYRYRWEIETFFKWLKCILGTRGFLAESRNGVTAQLYIALIMALLLAAFTGKRPNKRQMEAIQLYLMGWMSTEELKHALDLQKRKTLERG